MNLTKEEAEKFSAAAVAFKEWLVGWTEEVWIAIRPGLDAFKNAWEDAYSEAGKPYGPGDDGMWRWAKEVVEADSLIRRGEQILKSHQDLVGFRKIVAKGREK